MRKTLGATGHNRDMCDTARWITAQYSALMLTVYYGVIFTMQYSVMYYSIITYCHSILFLVVMDRGKGNPQGSGVGSAEGRGRGWSLKTPANPWYPWGYARNSKYNTNKYKYIFVALNYGLEHISMTFPAWQCMTKYRVTQKYIRYGHNHSYTPGFTPTLQYPWETLTPGQG